MALSEDLINFDLIEQHKENITQLKSGRSAKALVSVLSPLAGGSVTLDETKTLNDAIRQEYEKELQSIAESDDPLDLYDRYVKWTLNAYPSAQSTPQSQLLPLLERATKAFLTSQDYKNDPRYLKLWLHYIRLFSDAPRETFAFLARHNIGEHLALFYEEFASWLEGAGRWTQADEVYRMGIEKEARPAERLLRKYTEFQKRLEAQPQDDNEPSSPALPKVRAALATKIDPFAPSSREDSHSQSVQQTAVTSTKPKKQKMAIFSDADNPTPPPVASATNGWDNIGSMRERKKENTIEARAWTGETLKAGKRVGTIQKMEVFKDPNEHKKSLKPNQVADVVNPRTGRTERVFVNMDAVYSQGGDEFSFEELRAMQRGWTNKSWDKVSTNTMQLSSGNSKPSKVAYRSKEPEDIENMTTTFHDKLAIQEASPQSSETTSELKPVKAKKSKIREVKQETQTVKTRLESPTGRKVRRKGSAEPTMTFHSKSAHNDIYDMFNHARTGKDDIQSGDETDFGDGDDTYSTGGESTRTGRMSATNSEYGEESSTSVPSFGLDDTSVSPWSDFTSGKLAKFLNKTKTKNKYQRNGSEDFTENMDSSQNQTQNGFDTQAIAAIANQDFGELDTMAIAKIAAGGLEDDASQAISTQSERDSPETPVEQELIEHFEIHENPRYVPLPPEDYEPTPLRPYRDPEIVAQNKLPFMTPIVERTESSLAPSTIYCDKEYPISKTPSRSAPLGSILHDSPSRLPVDSLLLSSPQRERVKRKTDDGQDEYYTASPPKKLVTESPTKDNNKIAFPVHKPAPLPVGLSSKIDGDIFRTPTVPLKSTQSKSKPIHKGPIVLDLQCNPCDSIVRRQILEAVHPPISSYVGYHEYQEDFQTFTQIKSFAEKVAKQKGGIKSSPRKSQNEKTLNKPAFPVVRFGSNQRVYAVKRELGEGAFAPVFLVDSQDEAELRGSDGHTGTQQRTRRGSLEAIKAESPPETLQWEFHILHLVHSRLGSSSRALQSIVAAHECHLYRDECYLVLDYHSQGTLLDLVNHVRSETVKSGKAAEGLEEPVAMWFSVELLRVMEAVHKVGILHGDLKADNCLVRFDPHIDITGSYDRYGNEGWSSKGLTLIDFGRGIDVRAFKPEARFVADWKAEETDCAEIREARPWKWEIDMFGAAGIIHSLLFGRYIETVAIGGGGLGQKKEWKLRENFKRYWEKDIWTDVFDVLLNSGRTNEEEEARKEVARIRLMMEDWLENESERNGRDLRGGIRRCERLVGSAVGMKGKR